MKVAFLCKGSRGDVEPIIALTLALHKRQSVEVILVCCSSAVKGLENAIAKEQEWLKLRFLPEPTEIFQSQHQQKSDVLRQTLLNKEVACCVEACSNGVDAVVFNLFTLEGYFIAMHFKVPSVAVSPFLITKPPPKIFEKRFLQEHPFLYNELKKHTKGCVSYKEVDHWMWRLFLDDISTACDTAGIPSFPFPYPHPSSSSPPLTPWSLPPPTQLLYGISSTLVHREQFWPESIHLCGFWKLPDDWCVEQVDPNVRAYVNTHADRLVYTGFGSMETYINDIDWNGLLLTLNKVFEELGVFSIVQCIADGPIMNAVNGKSYSHLYMCPVYVSHSWLFPKCVTVIHHGGAGTVSSAIVAGVPQIICPVMFDQAHWGHIVEWKGLGKFINTGPSGLTCDQLHTAMSSVMKDNTIMTCIEDIKDAMIGTDTAVVIIEDISIQTLF